MDTSLQSCVVLADRHQTLNEGIRGLLETAFEAVVMVADAPSLFLSAARLRPTVCVVDLSLVPGDGLRWIRDLREWSPGVAVVLTSVFDEPSVCRLAIESGASAYVLKRAVGTDLLPALDAVSAGQTFISPGIREASAPRTAPSPNAERSNT